MARCPHKDVQFCPLYVASHIGNGTGCDDGKLEGWEGCALARGMSYRAEVERIRVMVPQLVERLAFLEDAQAAAEQRRRNLRLNGIH